VKKFLKFSTPLVALISLFFTITNIIPLSTLYFLWAAIFTPFILVKFRRLPKVTFWTLQYYIVTLTSLLIYDPSALTNFSFYRYDGNIIVTFLPLLFLPLVPCVNGSIERKIKIFIVFSAIISFFVAMYQYLNNDHITGLFISVNAFGGFLMTIIALNVSWLIHTKHRSKVLVLLIFCLISIWLTMSRGSLLGILLGLISLWAIRSNLKSFIAISLLSIVIVQSLIIGLNYHNYLKYKEDSYSIAVQSAESGKEANILIRVYENWPRGFYLFSHSPIFGTGFGSANDVPHILSEGNFFQLNSNHERIYNSAHAHHTYLHILGEQGLIGFVIFISILISIYRYIINNNASPFLKDTLLIIFFSLIFASFTEHRLPSPSNAFPFIIIFSIYFMINKCKHNHPHSEA